MKRLDLALELALILLLLSPLAATAQSPEHKGLAIAQEADKRDTGFGDFTADMQMMLMDKHGQKSERRIRIRTLEVEADGDKSLTIFDTPRDVKGTAFLNFTHKTGDDDQWLFLPALKSVKRISSRNKSGNIGVQNDQYPPLKVQFIRVDKTIYL